MIAMRAAPGEYVAIYDSPMVSSAAETVAQYLAELSDDRRELVTAVRNVVNTNLPDGYQEAMQYGMIGWSVPLDRYPPGYHTDPSQPLPLAALASQKQHVALYLMGIYVGGDESAKTVDAEWFRTAWLATGKKLNMGKSCVRFKDLDSVALDVVGEAIRRLPVDQYIARYEAVRPPPKQARRR
jgi:Domain of unknown function (DU1801)